MCSRSIYQITMGFCQNTHWVSRNSQKYIPIHSSEHQLLVDICYSAKSIFRCCIASQSIIAWVAFIVNSYPSKCIMLCQKIITCESVNALCYRGGLILAQVRLAGALAGANVATYVWLVCAHDSSCCLRWRLAWDLLIIDVWICISGRFWLYTWHTQTSRNFFFV